MICQKQQIRDTDIRNRHRKLVHFSLTASRSSRLALGRPDQRLVNNMPKPDPIPVF